MVPPCEKNTINFDAARLRRMGYSQTSQLGLQPVTLSELHRQLTLLLQTSLEAEQLLAAFFREIQRLVPLGAMTFNHPGSELSLQFGERGAHSASYNLNHAGEYMGELVFRRDQRFDDYELGQLESLFACLVFPLRNALLYRCALQNALRDPLTGTGNRIAMNQSLIREVDMAHRHGQPLCLLMLDLDHFKRINDDYGHGVGDDVLRAISAALKNQLRNVDMIFRFGGEEFMVLLSNTGIEAASLVGERLRSAVENLQYLSRGQAIRLSMSLGCAALQPCEAAESLVHRADEALYAAKRDGRNRMMLAG
jgi:diguanylate cyclase (GGDEF)-like protein